MLKLSISSIEEARANPKAYRKKMEEAGRGMMGVTYASCLRHAIFKYHKCLDPKEALRYIENRLAHPKLKSDVSKQETVGQLMWYMDEHSRLNWTTFQHKANISIPVPIKIRDEIRCTGEAIRIDLVPSGGYAVWFLLKTTPVNWSDELRWPIIQGTLSRYVLNVPPKEVQVGFYAYKEQRFDSTNYSVSQIRKSFLQFDGLFEQLGFDLS